MAPRRRLAALAFALAGITLLIGLGLWQIQRKGVKEVLIAEVEARASAPVLPFAEAVRLWQESLGKGLGPADGSNPALYRRTRLRGRFLHEREFHVLTPTREGPAWTVMTPVEVVGRSEGLLGFILVARGVVPDALKDPIRRPQGQVGGEVEIVGRLREPQRRNAFTPPDDPAGNRWYTRDVPAMAARLSDLPSARAAGGLGAPALYVEAEGEPPPGGWPRPNPEAAINLTNNHLQYALTWFSLAAVLSAISGLFLRPGARAAA